MREEAQDQIVLDLLNAVERNSALTQRTAAQELGIALGLANTYLRRCVRKGLIKIQQVPANRYAYYLTAHGFGEKARLTAKYLSASLGLFRAARQQFDSIFEDGVKRGWKRIGLAGASDLAEIAMLCAREFPITVAGIIDPDKTEARLAGLDIVSDCAALGPIDAVVITDMAKPQAVYDRLIEALDRRRVAAPPLLRISQHGAQMETADD